MIFFAVPKPDVGFLADFFFGLFQYLTECNRRPLVFTNYYSSMEFYRPTGASVFCPEILMDEDINTLLSRHDVIEDETYLFCKRFSPYNLRTAQRNALCCRLLPETIEDLLRLQTPSAAVVWNFFPPFNMVRDVLAKVCVPTYTTDKGLLGKTTFLDPRGMNGTSLFADPMQWNETIAQLHDSLDMEAASAYTCSYRNAFQSGWEQPDYGNPDHLRKTLGIGRDQHIIFVPTQVLGDSNMIMQKGRFHDNISFVKTLVKELDGRKDIFLLVKHHPKEPDPQDEMHKIVRGVGIWTKNINTFSAIEACSAVMTLNSTVGLEAALQGKPVVVFAPALYSHKGFTYEIMHDEEISSTLDVLLNDWQPDEKHERNLLNFLAFLLQYYLIPADGMQTADVYERYLNDCTSIDDQIGTNDFLYKKISDKEQEMKDVMRANICLSQSEGSMKQRIKTAIKKYFNF